MIFFTRSVKTTLVSLTRSVVRHYKKSPVRVGWGNGPGACGIDPLKDYFLLITFGRLAKRTFADNYLGSLSLSPSLRRRSSVTFRRSLSSFESWLTCHQSSLTMTVNSSIRRSLPCCSNALSMTSASE